MTLKTPQPGLVIRRSVDPGMSRWRIEAEDLPVGRLLDVRRSGRLLLDSGTVSAHVSLETTGGVVRLDLDISSRTARLPAMAGDETTGPPLGARPPASR